MGGDTDFLALYQDLGLAPGQCNLDELKRAYRRRVSMLHPDRCPEGDGDGETAAPEAMQRLTTLYGAAIAFERRFGRLPGAEPVSARRGITPPGGHATAPNSFVPITRREPLPPTEPKTLLKRVLLALVILLALAWALWGIGVIDH